LQLCEEISEAACAEKVVLPEDIVASTLGKVGKLSHETIFHRCNGLQKLNTAEFRSLAEKAACLAGKLRLLVPASKPRLTRMETQADLTSVQGCFRLYGTLFEPTSSPHNHMR
jgi:hypothetical protein